MAAFSHHPTGCACNGCNPDPEVTQLYKRIKKLNAKLAKVRPYVGHKDFCIKRDPDLSKNACDCGLQAILKEIRDCHEQG